MSDSNSIEEEEIQVQFLVEEVEDSGEEPPMSEWSSLIFHLPKENEKWVKYNKGEYSPGSGEICTKYIAQSDSEIAKHTLFQYLALTDNGIMVALNDPEPTVFYGHDGQEIYMIMCNEMNIAPINAFYIGLLNEDIDLRYYGINSQGVRAMAGALMSNVYVKSLNLKGNFLNGEACYHLGQMIGTNVTLERLNLSECRIGKSGLLRICNQIKENPMLTELNLSANNLNEEGGVYLASVLKTGPKLKELDLSKNSLGRLTAAALADAFDYHNELVKLDVSWNNMYQPPSTIKMIESLANSIVLKELYLAWNALEGDRIANAISYLLLNVPTISILDLSNNRFQGKAITIIITNLNIARKLTTLNLSSNPMTPADALTTLEKMLLGRVKIQNLLMDNVWVDKSFIPIKERVMKMKSRKNFKLTYAGILENYTITGPDPRDVVLKRADYLGKMNKKNPVDVGLFFLRVHKEKVRPIMLVKDLSAQARMNGIPLDEDLIFMFSVVFPGPKFGKSFSVDLAALVDHIHRIWPERKLPPTPPPELETNVREHQPKFEEPPIELEESQPEIKESNPALEEEDKETYLEPVEPQT